MRIKYTPLGELYSLLPVTNYTWLVCSTHKVLQSLAEPFNLGSYIQVMDFSKPVNSSQNSIDISTDNITTDIRLPDAFYDGALFISDGVMHMRPGTFTNTVLNFNLKTQKLDVLYSGIQYQAQSAAIAFDTEKQVGWYYGGVVELPHGDLRFSEDLYRLDRGTGAPAKVDVNSSSIGAALGGELVYLKDIGEAGILVLIGGATGSGNTRMVSMVNLN